MVKRIGNAEFESEVLKSSEPVLVDFFATWCGPCKMLGPVLEEISNEMSDVKIVKVDIDQNKELAEKYSVVNIPTMKIFKNGVVADTKVGFVPKDGLVEFINSNK